MSNQRRPQLWPFEQKENLCSQAIKQKLRAITATQLRSIIRRKFVYEPLEDPTACIRTFQIDQLANAPRPMSLTLTTHHVTEKSDLKYISYTALSYEWGPPKPLREILLNGRQMHIRSNLWQFLQHITSTERGAVIGSKTHFWADSICINQKDVNEKNSQVALMGEIFSNAQLVLAWVGLVMSERQINHLFNAVEEAFVSSDPAQTFLAAGGLEVERSLGIGSSRHRMITPGLDLLSEWLQVAECMSSFSNLEYWKRTWIVQELGLAQKVLVAAGVYRIELQVLKAMCQPSLWQKLPTQSYSDAISVQSFTASTLGHLGQSSRTVSLREVLLQYCDTVCQDPRDKVYALRSMAADVSEHQLLPDYSKSVCDIYWEVLELCKSDGSAFERKLLRMLNTNLESLISWSLSPKGYEKLAQASSEYGAMTTFRPGSNKIVACESANAIQQKGRLFTTEHGWRGITFGSISNGKQVSHVTGHLNLAVLYYSETVSDTCLADWAVMFDAGSTKAKEHSVMIPENKMTTLRKLERMHEACHEFRLKEANATEEGVKSWGRTSYKLNAAMVLALLIFREPAISRPTSDASAYHHMDNTPFVSVTRLESEAQEFQRY